MARGVDREKSMPRERYFDETYFALPQLFSFSYQIHLIYELNPQTILEIGVGNGFVSTFLKEAGYKVTTADINPELKPDIVSPISTLKDKISEQFDLVVCCEVLEHMPFETFGENIEIISELGRSCLITLPAYKRIWGFNGMIDLPKIPTKGFNLNFSLPNRRKKLEDSAHFWEVDFSDETKTSAIVERLETFYEHVENGHFHLNPVHQFFIGRHRFK